jgi:hypothetical protein
MRQTERGVMLIRGLLLMGSVWLMGSLILQSVGAQLWWKPNDLICHPKSCYDYEQYCVPNPPRCSGGCFASDVFPCDHCETQTGSHCRLRTPKITVRWYHSPCALITTNCGCPGWWTQIATYEVQIADC